MTQSKAREAIQAGFRRAADRNASFLAQDRLNAEGDPDAAALCEAAHEGLSEHLWAQFRFDWSKVSYNPGGTMGRSTDFLHRKAALTYAWALAEGVYTESVLELEQTVLTDLQVFWLEWAGYTLTSSAELGVALD